MSVLLRLLQPVLNSFTFGELAEGFGLLRSYFVVSIAALPPQ